jgi:hypothetical protein
MSGMLACPACEGTGRQLWFWQGRTNFPICIRCDGFGTLTWHHGAIGIHTLLPEHLRGSKRLVLK